LLRPLPPKCSDLTNSATSSDYYVAVHTGSRSGGEDEACSAESSARIHPGGHRRVVLASGFAAGHLIRAAAPAPSTHIGRGRECLSRSSHTIARRCDSTPRAPAASAAIGTWSHHTSGISLNSITRPTISACRSYRRMTAFRDVLVARAIKVSGRRRTGHDWKKVNTGRQWKSPR